MIRDGSTQIRALMPEWERQAAFDCDVWRPIHGWTLQQVIDIHHRHGVAPNPLYTRNHERVGCWPCINGKKAEINRMSRDLRMPLADRLRPLEDYAQATWDEQVREWSAVAEAAKAAGLTPEEAARKMGKSGRADPGKMRVANIVYGVPDERPPLKTAWFHSSTHGPMKVDEAIAWSQTRRGGPKTLELFAAPASDQGCMRWGLCDTGGRESQ